MPIFNTGNSRLEL